MNHRSVGLRVALCSAMLPLLGAGQAVGQVTDNFSTPLGAPWVQSNVLSVGTGPGTTQFSTTANPGVLTITNPTLTSGASQDVLLRSDVGLGIGQSIRLDVVSLTGPTSALNDAGLFIGTGTGITTRDNSIAMKVGTSTGLQSQQFNGSTFVPITNGFIGLANANALYIQRDAENVYSVGFIPAGLGTGVPFHKYTQTSGINPGAAVGVYADIRTAATGQARFDNFAHSNSRVLSGSDLSIPFAGQTVNPTFTATRMIDGNLDGISFGLIQPAGPNDYIVLDLGNPNVRVDSITLADRELAGNQNPARIQFFTFADDDPANNATKYNFSGGDIDVQLIGAAVSAAGTATLHFDDDGATDIPNVFDAFLPPSPISGKRFLGIRLLDPQTGVPGNDSFQIAEISVGVTSLAPVPEPLAVTVWCVIGALAISLGACRQFRLR